MSGDLCASKTELDTLPPPPYVPLLLCNDHLQCNVCMQVSRPMYYGDVCECDNFNCPVINGQICNG